MVSTGQVYKHTFEPILLGPTRTSSSSTMSMSTEITPPGTVPIARPQAQADLKQKASFLVSYSGLIFEISLYPSLDAAWIILLATDHLKINLRKS
ncbi:hypothetical protein EAI_00326 [Harpegnathos saltator]|uniref:Uncharacterized protein n=1 Tax=Harpegnathos saltator TaxID=610380 RepID=E2C1A7_HARSA|nr:hypothetical protein EAI_00326 [Harpegnathos saltator]